MHSFCYWKSPINTLFLIILIALGFTSSKFCFLVEFGNKKQGILQFMLKKFKNLEFEKIRIKNIKFWTLITKKPIILNNTQLLSSTVFI